MNINDFFSQITGNPFGRVQDNPRCSDWDQNTVEIELSDDKVNKNIQLCYDVLKLANKRVKLKHTRNGGYAITFDDEVVEKFDDIYEAKKAYIFYLIEYN